MSAPPWLEPIQSNGRPRLGMPEVVRLGLAGARRAPSRAGTGIRAAKPAAASAMRCSYLTHVRHGNFLLKYDQARVIR
jgi:hypothetical protein